MTAVLTFIIGILLGVFLGWCLGVYAAIITYKRTGKL